MDNTRMMDKRKKNHQRWLERQERSRLSRAEIDMLRKKREDLRASLDGEEHSSTNPHPHDDDDESNNNNINKNNNNNMDETKPPRDEVQQVYTHFNQLPLSQRTQMGLERGGYTRMTPIQTDTLHLALAGYDVLGAAKTGSGKTLCFVLPLLERLFVEQWDASLGVGALVLSPTRELALQIFKVLQVVGYKHVFSAALLTGGRDVAEERKRLSAISIIIGTPGRVLHHLEDDAQLVTDNVLMLVLDEADRLLDMGFRDALLRLLQHLPTDRQTLLFSATQTTDVRMLAHMSLRHARYVTAHASTAAPTPATLCQNFMVLEPHRKLDALLLFLKRHPNDKVVVFVSTCNQVRFMYLAFSRILKKMRIPCMCLTSKMKQFRREEVFLTFCRCKSAVLFCTDVAARGLDFPLVHWSVQFDCPDSAQTYIHRAGRTARAGARGVSLLFLTPRETPMLSFLAHKHIPLREIAIRPGMLQESREIFVALVVQGLKYEAQKAFIAYLRSIYFASNKLVFDMNSIDVGPFAHSLGLLKVPDMSELQNTRRGAKNLPWDIVNYMANRDQKQQTQQPCTRREKHLAASDMFRTLQQKQRYVTKDDDDDDDDEEGKNHHGDDEDHHNESTRKAKKGGRKEKDDEDDDDDNDDFLVKRPRTENNGNTDSTTMQLSVEERMAGLSKRKVRKYIEAADLRVRDLGLSKHIVFADDDDDEEEEEEGDKYNTETNKKKKNMDGEMHELVSSNSHDKTRLSKTKNTPTRGKEEEEKEGRKNRRKSEKNEEEESYEDEEDEDDAIANYAAQLRQHMQSKSADDTDRAKRLRRLRRLQRDGKIAKNTALEESGVSAEVRRKGDRNNDSEDNDDTDNGEASSDMDSISSGGSLARLIKAAKGELYSDDDDDDDNNNDDDTASHQSSKRSDSSEVASMQPQQKKKRRF